MVPERPGRGRRGLLAAAEGLVGVEGLVQQDREAPAVDRDVVYAPDERLEIAVGPDECQPRQRRSRRLESGPTVRGEEGREPLPSLGLRQPPPVVVLDQGRRLPMDDLVGTVAIAPVDRAPQGGMARDQPSPRLAQRRPVEIAPQLAGELLDIVPGLRVRQRVEEHARLDRGEGIDVVDPSLRRERAFQRAAIEPPGHERERLGQDGRLVGMAASTRRGRRQAGDRRRLEQLGRVHGQARLPGPRDEPDAEDRVDAQVEEVVVDADAVALQQLGRDRGEPMLGRRAAIRN